MPTPNEHPLSAPSDTDTRTSFATCPPEEEREQIRAQERRNDLHSYSALEVDEEEHTSKQEGEASGILHDNGMKTEHVEDISVLTDVSNASSPESSQENEACSFDTPDVEYLDMMSGRERIRPSITCPFLQPGSRFHGKQQSDRQTYDVQVEIKDVNMAESFLCGYLRIQGLTDDHPTLTTFFEGEIIGPKHRFKTTNPSWGSNEKVDLQHWERFPAWRPLAKSAKSPNFTLKNFLQREHLFMRWKEYFLVPDHRVKTITGASFEGFYYICFNQCDGSVSGIYFHAKSEKYQRLELKHVEDHGCLAAMEFR